MVPFARNVYKRNTSSMIKIAHYAIPYPCASSAVERVRAHYVKITISQIMGRAKYAISSSPNAKIAHLPYNVKTVNMVSILMMTTDAPLALSSITASTAPQPHSARPAQTIMAPTSTKPVNYAPNSSVAASFASLPINASYARLISTILSTISAESAQTNSRTAKFVQLKHATNAPIPPSSTTENASLAEISASAVHCALRETYAWTVCLMLSISRQQCAISAWIHCSTAKPVRIKHSA